MPTLSAIIGHNLRIARARKRWTQADLGKALGFSGGTISQIEQGNRVITVNELLPLCEALEVDLAFLLDGLDTDGMRRLGL